MYSLCCGPSYSGQFASKSRGLRKSPGTCHLSLALQREFVKSAVEATLQERGKVEQDVLMTVVQGMYLARFGSVSLLRPLNCDTIEAFLQELVCLGILRRELIVSPTTLLMEAEEATERGNFFLWSAQ